MKASGLAAALKSAFGEDAVSSPLKFLDTGYPPLNKILSGRYDGGFALGRLYEVFGEPSTGKTALATGWMSEAQRQGGFAIFVDWERSFNLDMAKSLGLDDDPSKFIRFRPRTWEEGNVQATKACKLIRESGEVAADAPIIVVFDSIAAAIPKSQAEKEIDEYTMNDTTALARVTSTTLKAQAQHAEDMNAIFVYLNQMRLKPGVVYGDPRTTPGGKAMEFYASGRLALGRQKIMDKGASGDKEFIGQNISIQCVKSKFTRPFQECSLRLMLEEDGLARFDVIYGMVEHLIDRGLIEYAKPRLVWDGKKYFVKEFVDMVKADNLYPDLLKMLP